MRERRNKEEKRGKEGGVEGERERMEEGGRKGGRG